MSVLASRTAIVTGAASGIGQAIAIALAGEGANVVIADIADASATEQSILRNGGQCLVVRCDVSSSADTRRAAGEALGRFGSIDILVNNAGIIPAFAPIEALSEETWDRVFDVNVKGMYLCTSAVVPQMRRQGRGKIINIGSCIFFVGVPMIPAYVASKGAVIGFSRSIARELGGDNIQVNVLTPGIVQTPGVEAMELPPGFSESLVAQQCVKRMGRTNDLVGAVLFLSSDASDFVSGQTINVDGGLFAH